MKKAKESKTALSIDQAILEAYIQLQYEKGASQVVLQDIAKALDIAFGTVRYHFNQAGKDVAQEALLYVMKKTYVYIDEKIYQLRVKPDFNPLHAYVYAMFDWIKNYPAEASLLAYYYYLCGSKTQVAVPNKIFLERARLRIEAFLHEAVGRGLYKPQADMAQKALELHALITGTCLIAGTQRSTEACEQQEKICLFLCDKILL